MRFPKALILSAIVTGLSLCPASHAAEVCTTQSQMQPAERDALAAAAANLARRIQSNDQTGLRSATIAEFQKDFGGIADVVTSTAPRLTGASPVVEQIYILDATTLQKTPTGAAPDAQFYCTLNKSQAEADFSIPQLPPGRYAFAMVRMESAQPWRLSFLLRSDGGKWQLAGLYPKALTAAGHDGLWYWQEARNLQNRKETWNAWLYLQQAQALLVPANFVSSTHLDKLQTELTQAAPPALSSGIGPDTPFVLKAADGTEFRFTAISVDDSLGKERVDVTAHLRVDALGDAATARKRNLDAMSALVASHPELRKAFHGVWIFADPPNSSPYATEQAMTEIR
jgi:hypothetical protein